MQNPSLRDSRASRRASSVAGRGEILNARRESGRSKGRPRGGTGGVRAGSKPHPPACPTQAGGRTSRRPGIQAGSRSANCASLLRPHFFRRCRPDPCRWSRVVVRAPALHVVSVGRAEPIPRDDDVDRGPAPSMTGMAQHVEGDGSKLGSNAKTLDPFDPLIRRSPAWEP